MVAFFLQCRSIHNGDCTAAKSKILFFPLKKLANKLLALDYEFCVSQKCITPDFERILGQFGKMANNNLKLNIFKDHIYFLMSTPVMDKQLKTIL